VDQNVAQPRDAPLIYLGILFPKDRRDSLYCFADNLVIANHGVLRHDRVKEFFSAGAGVLLNPIAAFQDMN
jgi:hypothetical protein